MCDFWNIDNVIDFIHCCEYNKHSYDKCNENSKVYIYVCVNV